ncbi:hypothetical protein Tco_0090518 [Tanacetum coccineum]
MLAKAQASEASSKAKVEACGSKAKLQASTKALIVKSLVLITNYVLRLANSKTCDAIKGNTFGVKIPPTMTFAKVKIGKRNLRKIIEISSDSSEDRKGASKATAPIFYGPSTQGLLDAYGYNTIEEYLSWNYFPSTDNESTDMETTDKRNTDKDCIVDSNSAMSKGKYVPVCKKHKPNMYSHVPVTGSVLGLPNVTTWDEIEKKMGARKSKTCADKAKGKRKVSSCTLHLQLAYAHCICTLHLQLAFARKHLHIALAHCICSLKASVSVLKDSIEEFGRVSSLIPIYNKSTLIFGSLSEEEKHDILEIMPFKVEKLPIGYLGVINDINKPLKISYGAKVKELKGVLKLLGRMFVKLNRKTDRFPMLMSIQNMRLDEQIDDQIMWKNSDGRLYNFFVKQTYTDLLVDAIDVDGAS